VTAEAVLAAGYALFLLVSALALDLLARHTGRRSQRFRTAGFRYHEHLDVWECPQGQHLWPVEHDRERRLVRYRGKAHICNACRVKDGCTSSDEGREVVRSLEDWPRSEAGRFHRAISLALIVLAAVITAVAVARNHRPGDLVAFGAVASVLAFAGLRLAAPTTRASDGRVDRPVPVARQRSRRRRRAA
jgi:hypothetical protein